MSTTPPLVTAEGAASRGASPAPASPAASPPAAASAASSTSAAPSKPASKPPAATVEDASDSEDEKPASTAAKGKGRATSEGAEAATSAGPAAAPPPHDWQAVWSPPQNAYYFYNTKTMETTWTNPLASIAAAEPSPGSRAESPPWDPSVETLPTASAATALPRAAGSNPAGASFSYGQASGSAGPSTHNAQQPAAGIHPGLAHLVPPSYNPLNPSGSAAYTAQARFNSRTGRYESDPNRAPEHLSDFARMRRQNEAFFDQAEWERQHEAEFEREREEGSKRKRATREEVAAFKAKKEAKRKKNNAWLRS